MKGKIKFNIIGIALVFVLGMTLLPGTSSAAPPVVKTVPWVATNPLIPHDTYTGKQITLKGTADVQGATIQYTWDFGDGSPVATGTVINRYAIEASHVYNGAANTVFTATLTINNTSTNESASKQYFVAMRDKTLQVEANIAIDEGLWYLHKTLCRDNPAAGQGRWVSCPGFSYASYGYPGTTASNINAFEVNGHLESGNADNPYTETVARGLKGLFSWLTTTAIPSSQTNGLGTFNPDTNGNGYGVLVNTAYPFYQSGMVMDAIVASGTPDAVTTTGPAPSGANPGILGRTYKNIVQDYADYLYYGQYDGSGGGGWRYSENQFPDNSPSQWAAIGLLAFERSWGGVVPQIVKDWNKVWLAYSQYSNSADFYHGTFGYQGARSFAWGPYATTPSGMVQLVMDGIGRGATGSPSWDKAETFMRKQFCNTGGATNAIKDYYYGLFSFVKAMHLHDSNGDGVAEPLTLLQTSAPADPAFLPIDWYAAEASKGAPCDGVARTLVNDQTSAGYWWGHSYSGEQEYFETAQAIIMLGRTLFQAGGPVAVAKAIPNPGVAGQTITLDGSSSYHQDPTKIIDSWEWDFNNDGIFDASGPVVTNSWPALGDYLVKLRVTDNASAEASAETIVTVRITIPPIAPTADANGPYTFCPNRTPWFLDGTGSVNPDEGTSEPVVPPNPPNPPNTIIEYAWDLDGDGQFDDASGEQPDVTAYFTGKGPGSYLIQLRVTDNTAASFPSSGYGNLSDTDSAQVTVKPATDPLCSCINNLAARAKLTKIQLTWTHIAGTHHYNVYRSTVSGGPYLKIGSTTSTYSTFLDNGPLTIGTPYYYVVRPAQPNGDEICQSNQASAKPVAR